MFDIYMEFVREIAKQPRIAELVPQLNYHAAFEPYARAAGSSAAQLTEREKRLALAHHVMGLVIEQDFINGADAGEPLGIVGGDHDWMHKKVTR